MPDPRPNRRDYSWLWCHQAGSHDGMYNLPDSATTPADAARLLGVERLIHVAFRDQPRPPLAPHAAPMRDASELVWSIVGDASSARNDTTPDLEPVLALADEYPQLSGAIMDDFFHAAHPDGELARWPVDAVADFQRRLHAAARPLDLWVVVYDLLLDLPIQPWLAHCDVVTYWTWKAENLATLEDAFARLEALTPDTRKLLGIYMWDYGCDAPMPMAAMQHQCAVAERLHAERRIDGVVFLASNLCGLDIDTVAYARDWIAGDV